MKNLIFLLVTIILPFLNSCTVNEETLTWENYSLNAEKQREFQESLLLDLSHARSEDFDATVSITKSKIENIEGTFYLRTFYNNGFVSTTLLREDNNEEENPDTTLEIGGTTCTSSSCSESGGCMPKLNGYCSPCSLGTKDCTRSSKLP